MATKYNEPFSKLGLSYYGQGREEGLEEGREVGRKGWRKAGRKGLSRASVAPCSWS
jgi:hypothetical protein